MDLPPPQTEVQQVVDVQNNKQIPPANIKFDDINEWYYLHVLSWIDSPDLPDNVKIFANNNNCVAVMKNYHWSDPMYKNGDVYSCSIKGKRRYILVKNNKIKFANWFKRKKLHIIIYDR